MSKEPTKEVRENKEDYTKKVTHYKEIARDSLRMQLINPRLAKINSFEKDITSVNKEKTDCEHEIKVETYEISKLDAQHPNFEKTKEKKEKEVKNLNECIKAKVKEVEEIQKDIEEQKERVQDIEHGKTLVSKEALNDLINKMIERDAIVKVD